MKKAISRSSVDKNKKTIPEILMGFDMDGVLIDHTAPKILIAGKFGINLKPEQTPSDVMRKIIPQDVWREIQQMLYDDKKYAMRPPVMRGARPALKEIEKSGTPIFLISRRKNPTVAVDLLEKNGLWPRFFHERNTYFVDEPEDKNIQAVKLGITHYLDDEHRVLEKLNDVPNRFLFDKHRIFSDTDLYHRVFSWQEFLSHLD